jgi:hypothetical protein
MLYLEHSSLCSGQASSRFSLFTRVKLLDRHEYQNISCPTLLLASNIDGGSSALSWLTYTPLTVNLVHLYVYRGRPSE